MKKIIIILISFVVLLSLLSFSLRVIERYTKNSEHKNYSQNYFKFCLFHNCDYECSKTESKSSEENLKDLTDLKLSIKKSLIDKIRSEKELEDALEQLKSLIKINKNIKNLKK